MRTSYFDQEQISRVRGSAVPAHIAIILDGNRRYAKEQGKAPFFGHQAGSQNILDIVKAAKELGVGTLTLYVFSSENWNRSPFEVAALMQLFENFLLEKLPEMIEEGVHLRTIGSPDRLPNSLQDAISKVADETQKCKGITVLLAINYGARDEIVRACKKMLADYSAERLNLEDLTEQRVGAYLDTSGYPDPDLLIRTAGVKRLSNFLLWQSSYAEIYISDLLWPEFQPSDLLEAVVEYQGRERRLGL